MRRLVGGFNARHGKVRGMLGRFQHAYDTDYPGVWVTENSIRSPTGEFRRRKLMGKKLAARC